MAELTTLIETSEYLFRKEIDPNGSTILKELLGITVITADFEHMNPFRNSVDIKRKHLRALRNPFRMIPGRSL